MEEKENLPTLSVGWNAEAQGVALHFDPKQFRSWEFVVGVLQMALAKAEQAQRLQHAQQMQRAVMEQAQNQALRQQILRQ